MTTKDDDPNPARDTASLRLAQESVWRLPRAPCLVDLSSPLRIQVFSDLHLDINEEAAPPLAEGADLVVVAGDTCEDPARGFELLRRSLPSSVEVLTVAGNHDFYRGFHHERLAAARDAAPKCGVTFLEDEAVMVRGTLFIGATLWTDYGLLGDDMRPSAMRSARTGMNDHRRIGWTRSPWERFRPEEALRLHMDSRAFIERSLAACHDGPTIVVTHHAPAPQSLGRRPGSDCLDAAYASDLSGLIAMGQPTLWVHGHVHRRLDYRVGSTRVLCNPRGYGSENPLFDPALVIEVTR